MMTMTTAQMIAEYNALTGKAITRFSSRAAGERQLANARAVHKPQQEKPPMTKNEARSTAVAASWSDADVKAARSKRDNVVVINSEGKSSVYKSVRAAFVALELPLGSHIKFRMRLKKEKKAEFQDYEFALM